MAIVFGISYFLGLSRPIIIPAIQEQFAQQVVSISCHFSFCPDQYLSWNGTALGSPTASERVTIMTGSSESVLTISSLMEEDEGQYYCSCNGVQSALSILVVHRKELISYQSLMFSYSI